MHELSIAENILDVVLRQSQEKGFQKVLSIHLRMGRRSGIEQESLRFCFGVVSADSIAQSAHLVIEIVPLRGRCPQCLQESEIEEFGLLCPHCRSPMDVTSGMEIHLDSMEVE